MKYCLHFEGRKRERSKCFFTYIYFFAFIPGFVEPMEDIRAWPQKNHNVFFKVDRWNEEESVRRYVSYV